MSLTGLFKDKLIFDPTDPNHDDGIGAFVRAGNDGTQISWTANVNVAASLIMQDLTYTAACTDYVAGNGITVAYVSQSPALSQPLSVVVAGLAITVNLATDGAGADSSTAAQIAAAINADLAAAELVSASVSGTGTNIQAPQVATNLAGGTLKQALDVHNLGSPLNGQFHEDCQHDSGAKGQFILAVRHDADTSMVSHDGDYAPLQVDENGNLKVIADLDVDFDYVYAEDAPSADGNLGAYVLTVRSDSPGVTTSLNGDFQSFKTDSVGKLWVNAGGQIADDAPDGDNPMKVGSRSEWGALAALSNANDRADLISDKYRRVYVNNGANIGLLAQPVTVAASAGVVIASALDGRRTLMIQNLGNKDIYIGGAGVTVLAGFRVARGATFTIDLGQDVALYAISESGSQNVRVLEFA